MPDISEQRRSIIDEWCDRFEAEWKSAARPKLAEYLQQWTGPGQEELFRFLLELDVDYRRRSGADASVASYRQEFPEFEPIILEVVERDLQTVSWRRTKTRPPGTPSISAPPSTIGDYEILSALGQGGMGVVYKARQRSLNRLVALKMIRSGEFAYPEEQGRFQAEAEAAASLSHPAIVPVYEVGNEQGRLYFSMELVEGGSLSSQISEQPMTPKDAARLVEQVARAIAYAHDKGVIHRDLKPGNILVDRHGSPRIMDFGLAKRLDVDRELTATGQILGTPNYMPPEQARGDLAAISPRSDIFSLGAVLYRLIAGRPPFQAATLADTLYDVQNTEALAPSKSARGIPRDLDTICLKCLEKSPSERYASAHDLADELARFLRNEPIRARPLSLIGRIARWSQRNPVVASLSGACIALLVTGLAVSSYYSRAAESRRQDKIKAEKLASEKELEAKTAQAAKETAVEANERGAYVRDINRSFREWTAGRSGAAREVLQATPVRLRQWEFKYLDTLYGSRSFVPPLPNCQIANGWFLPDNRLLAGGARQLTVWDLNSKQPVRELDGNDRGFRTHIVGLAEVPAQKAWVVVLANGQLLAYLHERDLMAYLDLNLPVTWEVRFSNDGRRMVAASVKDPAPLRIWDLERLQALASPDLGEMHVVASAVSHDGSHYAAVAKNGQFVLGKIAGDNVPEIRGQLPLPVTVFDVALRNANTLLFSTSSGVVQREPDGSFRTLFAEQGALGLATSPRGRYLVVARLDKQLRLFDLNKNQDVELLTGQEGLINRLQISSDERKLIAAGVNQQGQAELRVWELDRNAHRQTEFVASLFGPALAISPDQKLAVLGTSRVNDPQQSSELRLVDTATGQAIQQIPFRGAQSVSFSEDGQFVLIQAEQSDQSQPWACWSVEAQKMIALPERRPDEYLLTGEISTGGEYLAAYFRHGVTKDIHFRVWRVADGQVLFEPATLSGNTQAKLAFNRRGDHLAFTDLQGVNLLQLPAGKVLHSWPHDSIRTQFTALRFSSDGQLLAAGDAAALHVWDTTQGKRWQRVRAHEGGIAALSFSTDGERLVTAGTEGSLKIWDWRRGHDLLTIPVGTEPRILQVDFSREERLTAVTLGVSGVIHEWSVNPALKSLRFPSPNEH